MLLSYMRNKMIAENKPELASFLLDLNKHYYAAKGQIFQQLNIFHQRNLGCSTLVVLTLYFAVLREK